MARHAGFAVAASVGEAFINQSIWAAFEDLEPIADSLLFAIPSSAPIGGGATARLSGVALFERHPTVHLVANPANTVTMTASAVVFVAANTDPVASVELDQTWKLRISATVEVGLDIDVAPDGLYLRWIPGTSAIDDLHVAVLEGPGVPQWLIDALNSADVHAAMSRAVQMLGPRRVSPRLLQSTFHKEQKGPNDEVWFTLDIAISRVAVQVRDGSVAIGVDFAGITGGVDSQLVDLALQPGEGPAYRWPIYDNTTMDHPLLVMSGASGKAVDLAVLVNADAVGAIVADISRQLSNRDLGSGVRLRSLTLQPAWFDKPLRGRELGLRAEVTVNHDIAGDVTGRVFIQPFLMYDAEDNATPFPSEWRVYIGKVEFDVPWWVDVAVVVTGLALSVLVPALGPLLAVGVLAAIDGIIPGVIDGFLTQAQDALGGTGTFLALGVKSSTLPTHKQQPSWENVERIKVSTDGLDARMSIVAASVRFGTGDATADVATVTTHFDPSHRGFYWLQVTLRDDLAVLSNECTVQLVVTRGDDGTEVGRSEGPFNGKSVLAVNQYTPDRYHLDQYHVRARVWLNRESMTGLLFAAEVDVQISEPIDRHRKYVTWEEHWAHFASRGSQGRGGTVGALRSCTGRRRGHGAAPCTAGSSSGPRPRPASP